VHRYFYKFAYIYNNCDSDRSAEQGAVGPRIFKRCWLDNNNSDFYDYVHDNRDIYSDDDAERDLFKYVHNNNDRITDKHTDINANTFAVFYIYKHADKYAYTDGYLHWDIYTDYNSDEHHDNNEDKYNDDNSDKYTNNNADKHANNNTD